jgi:hypothetical protein
VTAHQRAQWAIVFEVVVMLLVSTQIVKEVLPGTVWTEHEIETATMSRAFRHMHLRRNQVGDLLTAS